MQQIHRLDNIAEVRSVFEIDVLREKRGSAMNAIRLNGKVFGKVPMRSLTGNKHRLREAQPWDWQPRTLREAELFRNKREDRGKHLTRFVPCANAPIEKTLSFNERNLIRRFGKIPHHLSTSL
jgi:hypothetical protein